MDQYQGAIVDNQGHHVLDLHVSVRVNGNKWKGVIESAVPVAAAVLPEKDKIYRLRLANGQEKTIHVDTVTITPLQSGSSFRATFTSSSAAAAPPTQAKPAPG